ncbi:MAG: hypothetical protein AABX51_05595 [Nanoarchaeota archaeon]
MADDGFEELDDLRKELSGRKEDTVASIDLFTSVKALSIQIEQLTDIFKMAIGQMTNEDDIMKKVSEQLEQLLKNDQDLARGLLLVLEIEKDKREFNIDRPIQSRRGLSRRRMSGRPRMGMPPSLPDAPGPEDLEVEFPENAGRPGTEQ